MISETVRRCLIRRRVCQPTYLLITGVEGQGLNSFLLSYLKDFLPAPFGNVGELLAENLLLRRQQVTYSARGDHSPHCLCLPSYSPSRYVLVLYFSLTQSGDGTA